MINCKKQLCLFSGKLAQLEDAVVSASKTAFKLIDLRKHDGGHPRLGSVDLIPLHPITEDTSLEDCGEVARRIVTRLANDVPGSSYFLYGAEDDNLRGLIERRKQFGWFQSSMCLDQSPDVGAYIPQYGLTGVGSSPYMSNFNISLDTTIMKVARDVLRTIRDRSGGLPGVSAMAFPHQGSIEVACNVDMFR